MQTSTSSRILWSVVWALAIIASAFLFKGTTYAAPLETALTGLGLVFVVLKSPRPDCLR